MDMVSPGKSYYFGALTYFTEFPVIFLIYQSIYTKQIEKKL